MTTHRYLNGYRVAVGHTRADGYQEEITEYEAMEIEAECKRERDRRNKPRRTWPS